MSYNKEYYAKLKEVGYLAKDAHRLASRGKKAFKELLQIKIQENIESGMKVSRKVLRQWAKIFDFTNDEADRIKGFSNANFLDAIKTKSIPIANELFKLRATEGITYKKALQAHMLIAKSRTGEKYFYKIRYEVFHETDYFRTEKFVTIVSRKKLNKNQVFERALESLSQYDETYKAIPDPSTFEIIQAYYMSENDYKKLEKMRGEKYKR